MATKNSLAGVKLRGGETWKLTFLGRSCLGKGGYEWEYGQDSQGQQHGPMHKMLKVEEYWNRQCKWGGYERGNWKGS